MKKIFTYVIILLCLHLTASLFITLKLDTIYIGRESAQYTDIHDNRIVLLPNGQNYLAEYTQDTPERITRLLLLKEDNYFYMHPGINPLSIVRSMRDRFNGEQTASSTLTLQLAKVLLSHESNRSLLNKITEIYVAISLETIKTKDEILEMYLNSVFLGNNTQGISTASRFYFDKNLNELTDTEIFSLLTTLNSPSVSHPFTLVNVEKSKNLINKLQLDIIPPQHISQKTQKKRRQKFHKYLQTKNYFELRDFNLPNKDMSLTIDDELSNTVRDITYTRMQELFAKNAFNASVVIIKIPENEVLAIIGTPNPEINDTGYQINMSRKPRQIGSTIKPFIYTKGFEINLRPYTIVNDREYKYMIGSGYPLYPKNYDYTYSGDVTLHHALANSLNVPTVKVLDYITFPKFSSFLLNDLQFMPYQDLAKYQLGIALGELDMSLLELSHYFTIFPQDGHLKPLTFSTKEQYVPQSLPISLSHAQKIFDKKYTDLTNTILNDRQTGVAQFGTASNLNLPFPSYCVKTGTSEGFRDSLTIGYTKDFLVGVWVGNNNFEKMDGVSGQTGAGSIWHDVMMLMYNSHYNKNTPLDLHNVIKHPTPTGEELSLANDNYDQQKNLLSDTMIIHSPHDGDIFAYESDATTIYLEANTRVSWFIDDILIGIDNKLNFEPTEVNRYKITAQTKEGQEQSIFITIVEEDI